MNKFTLEQIACALKQAEAGTRIDEREGFIDNRKHL
jgi:hypothetical protein